MKSKWLQKVPLWRLIGPVIVVAAIWWAGPGKVWGVLSSADVRVVAAVLLLSIPMVTIKAVRWRILLSCYGIELGFRDSVSMYATGIVFSAVTPGRVGDMVKILCIGFSSMSGNLTNNNFNPTVFRNIFNISPIYTST